jgi:hypothetical protein
LQVAAQHDHVGALCELLNAKACVRGVQGADNRSPVQLAIDNHCAGTLRALLAAKADVHVPRVASSPRHEYDDDGGNCQPHLVQTAADYGDAAILQVFADADIALPPRTPFKIKLSVIWRDDDDNLSDPYGEYEFHMHTVRRRTFF